MKTDTIVYCVVALLLGMLLANMLKSVCGCKLTEGLTCDEMATTAPFSENDPCNQSKTITEWMNCQATHQNGYISQNCSPPPPRNNNNGA